MGEPKAIEPESQRAQYIPSQLLSMLFKIYHLACYLLSIAYSLLPPLYYLLSTLCSLLSTPYSLLSTLFGSLSGSSACYFGCHHLAHARLNKHAKYWWWTISALRDSKLFCGRDQRAREHTKQSILWWETKRGGPESSEAQLEHSNHTVLELIVIASRVPPTLFRCSGILWKCVGS